MADLLPRDAGQWMRWVERRLTGLERRRGPVIREVMGGGPPTTGEWAVGERVWNWTPAPGEYIGWVCTAAGSPGTWSPFGLIV